MKISYKKNSKTITEDGDLELGSITIFAGENNSGKTQIIAEIEKSLTLDVKNNVIKIPAEKVILDNEVKNTAKSDEFRKTLENLISLELGQKAFSISSEVDDIETELPKIFSECNVENIELKVSKNKPKESDYVEVCKEVYAKNVIGGITIKDLLNKKDGIKLSEAGQGTERLVIVSLIRYLSKKKNISKQEPQDFLIIEEPEIFLHPRLKRDFNKSLKKLASDGIKVILTTHDPYFISLNEKEKIYHVSRQQDGSTKIQPCEINKKLDDVCHSEISYQVFNIPTLEYALLLYDKLNTTSRKKTFSLINLKSVSLRDFRNQFSHPNESLVDFDEKDSFGKPVVNPRDIKEEGNLRKFIETCLVTIK